MWLENKTYANIEAEKLSYMLLAILAFKVKGQGQIRPFLFDLCRIN